MDGVATPIIGRPRPLPGHDTPNPAYHPHTLNYEEPHSTLEPTRTRSFSPGHSHPSLTASRNLAPNRETPLNPQNQRPLTSRSPLPRHTSTQVDKLVPKRHRSGTSTYGHMRSTPETQKTS